MICSKNQTRRTRRPGGQHLPRSMRPGTVNFVTFTRLSGDEWHV